MMKYQTMDTKSRLREIRAQNIMDVDSESLSELKDIKIDPDLPVEERVRSLLEQTDNPYCFKYNGMVVKVSFAGKMSIEECLTSCFFSN